MPAQVDTQNNLELLQEKSVAVAKTPKPIADSESRTRFVLDEIYSIACSFRARGRCDASGNLRKEAFTEVSQPFMTSHLFLDVGHVR
jgi:hypothetical protein